MDSAVAVLTHKNFLIYAGKHYDNPHCSDTAEFLDDLRRIKHTKKLLTRYDRTGELRARLILNHIIVLSNCFGAEATCRILFLKLKNYLHYVKPFLILLNLLPDIVWNIEKPGAIRTDDIPLDPFIVKELRTL